MPDPSNILNVGDLAKPATTLIDRIADAIGGFAAPWQIKRVAQAHADAKITNAKADIEIAGLQMSAIEQRAFRRLIHEEGRRQGNIESITAKALPDLAPNSRPERIEEDWLVHFFDRGRLISDDQMQSLWAHLLANEANAPGSFSRRTVDIVSLLDKRDAEVFTSLCRFNWHLIDPADGTEAAIPLIFDVGEDVYTRRRINLVTLTHLSSIGLISLDAANERSMTNMPPSPTVRYFDTFVRLGLGDVEEREVNVGHAMFTTAGQELAPICVAKPDKEFLDYVLEYWSAYNPAILPADAVTRTESGHAAEE